jgi:hypothetical protein|tara:strand:- start:7481 stop:7765 length:285 start_codon:yes stop_codon:yes gene_type:complete
MTHNFQVGDVVETIQNMPIWDAKGDGSCVKRRLRTGNFHIVQTNQWVGYPSTVEAIDCGKTKRIKVGGCYYMPHRLRVWDEKNRKVGYEPRERA